MLTAKQIAQFDRDGFLLGDNVLNDEQVEQLQREIERVIADQKKTDAPQPTSLRNLSHDPETPVWQIVNIWLASEPFHQLVHCPAVAQSVAQLTRARELRLWHDQVQYKPAAVGGVNMWHQDSPYWGPLSPKDQQVTAWVALDDVDEENGCMSMVPGSHHWGRQDRFLSTLKEFDAMPDRFDGHDVRTALCPVRKGSVHFHHSLTWHGSCANRSGRPRRAIALHFMTDQTVYDPQLSHCCEQYIRCQPGQKLEGEYFPLVYQDASPCAASPVPAPAQA